MTTADRQTPAERQADYRARLAHLVELLLELHKARELRKRRQRGDRSLSTYYWAPKERMTALQMMVEELLEEEAQGS